MTRRGAVVLCEFPFVEGGRGKIRPALVVQNDRLNGVLTNTIVAMISGNTRLAGKVPTQVLVDPTMSDGRESGLRGPSVIKCENLFTIRQVDILQEIGVLSESHLSAVATAKRQVLSV